MENNLWRVSSTDTVDFPRKEGSLIGKSLEMPKLKLFDHENLISYDGGEESFDS